MNRIAVHVEQPGGATVLAGWIDHSRSVHRHSPSLNFEYTADYLSSDGAYALSPDLPLQRGLIPAPMVRQFAAFDDAGPDQWGTRLIQAEHRRRARAEGVSPGRLTELDILLLVPDLTRQGALRFSEGPGSPFLGSGDGVTEVTDLEQLVHAAASFDEDTADDSDLRRLVPIGTTQGGARPKVAVRSSSGSLAIAKLPRPSDRWDVLAWEAASLDMAKQAGLPVPRFELRRLNEFRSVLIVDRFDRTPDGGRVGYLSVKNLVAAQEGEMLDYAALATLVGEHAQSPEDVGHGLFRRAVLTLMVNNIDDHLKNHGVLRSARGWDLSPVFDVNPFPNVGSESSTPMTDVDDPYDRDVRLLLDSSARFRLTGARAAEIVLEVERATSNWAELGIKYGIDPEAVSRMGRAFENPNRERAADVVVPSPRLTLDMADRGTPSHATGDVWVPSHTRQGASVEGHWRRRPPR